MFSKESISIGCCITPHGFGHAARACAIMEALSANCPVHFEIVTTVPEWFFVKSLTASYTRHPLCCDIGLVQRNALEQDLGQTTEQLDVFYPLDPALVDRTAAIFASCQLVICDIAPLGIVAADRAGTVSVLIENFTWDWIYHSYCKQWPGFTPHVSYLQQLYGKADYHLQAEPVCRPAPCDLLIPPVARQGQEDAVTVRERLQVTEAEQLVLVTMGGVPGDDLPRDRMAAMEQFFVLTGQSGEEMVQGNLRILPPDSGIYHPDLVAASDAVIGKVGYSTLAEVFQAAIPFGYICRPGFRESPPLAAFIKREMVCREITWQRYQDASWLDLVPELCSMPPGRRNRENGAGTAANFLAGLLAADTGR